MKNNNIFISQIFWSVPDLQFADNILSLGLKIKKIKSSGECFNTYQLSNDTKIIGAITGLSSSKVKAFIKTITNIGIFSIENDELFSAYFF